MFAFIKYLIPIFLLTSCMANEPKTESSIKVFNLSPQVELTNLDIPWSLTKKDTIFYISQRKGSIIAYDTASKKAIIQPVQLSDELSLEGEGGFLGLELSPDFLNTGHAFAYYSYKKEKQILNRLVLIKENENMWKEEKVLLDHIPGAVFHNGGRVKIGPDQKLYVTVGDGLQEENAQNLTSLSGKILRLNLDGSIPTDNPFPNSYVYSYGHRNPQGLTWDEQGNLYASEHGESAHDEINLIEAGKNYGWPVIEGDEKAANMVAPLFHSGNDTWAPSGISFYKGKLYVATLRGAHIREFDLVNKTQKVIFDQGGRMRDTFIENNTLYFVSNNLDGRGTPDKQDDRLYSLKLK